VSRFHKHRLLLSSPVELFIDLFPALQRDLVELAELRQLLGDDGFVVVGHRLAIPAETPRGADPGGFWV
jgi:hypothetical protein